MTDYYDSLAPYYKLMYSDWEMSVDRQASILSDVINEYFRKKVNSILDVACGIGTQSIGLAKLGYTVTASDISQIAIEQAKQEAVNHGVEITFDVNDMKFTWDKYQTGIDLVLACDNAIPHLLSKEEILSAFRQFFKCVNRGGGCLISVRDYGNFDKPTEGTKLNPRLVHKTEDQTIAIFDTWDFSGDQYLLTTYLVFDKGDKGITTQVIRGGKYYCVEIPVLVSLFYEAGFTKVFTIRERYFQPLILALKNQ